MKKNIFLLALSFFLVGCGETNEKNEEQVSERKTVSSIIVQRDTLTPQVSFSGTLLPQTEADISAEASGNVYRIWAEEGDTVYLGQTLLSFASGDNIAQIDVENAQQSLADAEKALLLTQQQVVKSLESSRLAVEQAQSNLDSAKKTNYSTGTSADAQKKSAESSVDLAQLSLENAKTSYTELLERLATDEKNITDTRKNAISSSLAVFRKVLADADAMLGVNPETKDDNNNFEVYLGFYEPQTKIDAVNLFRTAWVALIAIENLHSTTPENVTIAEMDAVANDIRALLQKTDTMLKQSVSGAGFTESSLSTLKTQNSTNRSTLEGSIASLTSAFGQVESFITSKPQQIRGAELAIEQAEKQLIQSQSSLSQIESGADVSVVGTENQVENAKNNLLTAKSQLEFAEKQNELSVQQAVTAKNNALSSLRRAQIQAGKLVITSPIYGVITNVQTEAGNTVNAGAPLFSIANINQLVLSGEMEPNILSQVKIGTPAEITIDGFEKQAATVSKIYPVASEVSRRIPIEITLENKELKIPANIFAKAEISLPAEEGVILIPQNALVSQNPASVFILEEKEENGEKTIQVQRQEVTTGRTQNEMIEIREGLLAGQYIVPSPVVGLKEGDFVEVQK